MRREKENEIRYDENEKKRRGKEMKEQVIKGMEKQNSGRQSRL